MSITVFTAVLIAAALHAGWNLLVKRGADKDFAVVAVVFGHTPYALVSLMFVPLPGQESWPYIICGAAIHVAYQYFLGKAYQVGDFTKVYPIARGSAPMFIAVASYFLFENALSSTEWLAIFIICAGVTCLAIPSGKSTHSTSLKAFILAILTGVFIASYSLVDGIGAIKSGSALGFYACLTLFNGAFMLALRVVKKDKLASVRTYLESSTFWLGGFGSFAAFAITIWAFTQAPIALVSALRETSIIFALIFGHFILKEKTAPIARVSVLIILSGLVLSRLA